MGNIGSYYKVGSNVQNQRSEDVYFVSEAKSAKPDAFVNATIPRNPGLADNNFGSPHCDSYCSESVDLEGPNTPQVRVIRQRNPYGFTPCMVCNEANQMIGVAMKWEKFRFYLVVYDSDCNLLSTTPLAFKPDRSFAGGYFFLDKHNYTIVVSENYLISFDTQKVTQKADGRNPVQQRWKSIDLTTDPKFPQLEGNKPYSAMPVWGEEENLFWVLFSGSFDLEKPVPYESACAMAVVKIVEHPSKPDGCVTIIHDAVLLDDQWNNNTFSVDQTGAYFVTNAVEHREQGYVNASYGYLYKMQFDSSSKKISTTWRAKYDSCGYLKNGQKNIGSGTTPTLTDSADAMLVAITDNANPRMNVCVYNRENGSLVSRTPVFAEMRSADEASLIGVGDTLIVESNYGHVVTYPFSQAEPIEPGMSRIDTRPCGAAPGGNATVCWTDDRTSFLAMSMLARKTGVVFAHTADWSGFVSATEGAMYYMNAIDAFTGRTIWRVPMGRGVDFCHDFGGVYFNRDGNLFVGTANYIVSIQKVERDL